MLKDVLVMVLGISLVGCSTVKVPPNFMGNLEEEGAHCVKVDEGIVCDYKKETDKSTSRDWELYKDANGRLTRLTENTMEESYPHSDGNVIVFQRVSIDDKADIYSMKLNGSDVKRLTEKGNNWFPRISKDGKIAFVSNRDRNDEIYVMNIDGSNQERVTKNPGRDGYPRWIDGKLTYRNGDGPYHYVVIENGEHKILRFGW